MSDARRLTEHEIKNVRQAHAQYCSMRSCIECDLLATLDALKAEADAETERAQKAEAERTRLNKLLTYYMTPERVSLQAVLDAAAELEDWARCKGGVLVRKAKDVSLDYTQGFADRLSALYAAVRAWKGEK